MTEGRDQGGVTEMLQREIAGIRCIEVLNRLSEYLDGELPEEVRAAIDRHLETCGQCESFGLRFTATIQALRKEMATADPVGGEAAGRIRRSVLNALNEIEGGE